MLRAARSKLRSLFSSESLYQELELGGRDVGLAGLRCVTGEPSRRRRGDGVAVGSNPRDAIERTAATHFMLNEQTPSHRP